MLDRFTLLNAFANRAELPTIWGRAGVVQAIEHESGSGRSWIVTMQGPDNRHTFVVLWSLDGTGRII